MLFSDSYLSISAPAKGIYKDRGSKFLSYVYFVSGESEIRERLAELRKEHSSARHHCYAWRLGAGDSASRANDDGEPSGSAGKPILNQIVAKDLTNILIVVVRYFGGTLLGVGGLINAYKMAAADAISHCDIKEYFILFEYEIVFGFEAMNQVMKILKDSGAEVISNGFDENHVVLCRIKRSLSDNFEERMKGIKSLKLTFVKMI